MTPRKEKASRHEVVTVGNKSATALHAEWLDWRLNPVRTPRPKGGITAAEFARLSGRSIHWARGALERGVVEGDVAKQDGENDNHKSGHKTVTYFVRIK